MGLCVLRVRSLIEALQKDVAETAIPGTPDSRYQICACLTEETKWLLARFLTSEGETLGKGTYGEVVKAKDKQTRSHCQATRGFLGQPLPVQADTSHQNHQQGEGT